MLDVQEQANALYRGLALAPMVRASTTPLRTLALEYGADLVYSEELIDRSLIETLRRENETLHTIDYIKDPSQMSKKVQRKLAKEQRPCLMVRIDPAIEQQKLICQLGTGEPDLALQASQHVYQDFAAIDINMGCPKKFSVSGGMGSALLGDPERASNIITTLRNHIPRPISCKIRLLATTEATIDFIERMITAGVNAVAIHARRVGHDAIEPADWKTLTDVMMTLRSKYPQFPFLLNGDFYDPKEIQDMMNQTGASGILLGRPALYNTSIFRHFHSHNGHGHCHHDGTQLLNKTTVIQRYLQHAARYDVHFKNPKYVVCEMMNNRRAPTPRVPYLPQDYPGQQTIAKTCNCTSLQQIFQVWNLEWKGIGKEALGIIFDDPTTNEQQRPLPQTHVEPELVPGEHRYEDSYFLKKRQVSNDEQGAAATTTETKDSKRIKIENGATKNMASKELQQISTTTNIPIIQEEEKKE